MVQHVRTFKAAEMTVLVYANRDEMGQAVAAACAQEARRQLALKDEVNILFPCAFSHSDFFKYFFSQEGVDWARMNAFVMDEYLGLPENSPYLLSNFAQEHIFSKAPFKACYAMDGAATDFDAECARYAKLLEEHPLDMACLGIGETGHLAYNEPDSADFNDPLMVKHVKVDEQSFAQAVHDGAFPDMDSVPRHAMTVTIPLMMAAEYKQAVCPTAHKAAAVYKTVYGEISTDCPASILRRYDCKLYLDIPAASKL
ncbi:MAG: 6-phosphogluconolactonase [Christensenellales bacterium]|jgi:glucosamine-6-phosphate deaminase